MKFKREEDLEMATVPFIEKYFDNWSWQVPNHNLVIDFGGIKKNTLIGIEYKLSNWKRGIWQARGHRLAFDYLYVLLPFRKISVALCKEARKHGIGILLFNVAFGKSIDVIIKPKWQRLTWPPNRKEIIRHIKEIALHKRQFSNEEWEIMKDKFIKFNSI